MKCETAKPTLLLDRSKVMRNIERMAEKAKRARVRFRPHFKTHQSAEIGNWFREAGVSAITVSSLDMAHYFAEHGWRDITVAFPLNIRQGPEINELAGRTRLGLLVDSEDSVEWLRNSMTSEAGVWIKIDTGYGRAGIRWDTPELVIKLARSIRETPRLSFAGILTHCGHCYHASGPNEIRKLHLQSIKRMGTVRAALKTTGIDGCAVSIGDTPSCSLAEEFGGADEIRPGNFVFYDLMQLQLGTCSEEDIAVAVACPVVGKYEQRNEILIHGGAVHLSKEFLEDSDGKPVFGRPATATASGFGPIDPESAVTSLSQEHGTIRAGSELLNRVKVGDLLTIIPVHSCLTANLFPSYYTLDGTLVPRFQSMIGSHGAGGEA